MKPFISVSDCVLPSNCNTFPQKCRIVPFAITVYTSMIIEY